MQKIKELDKLEDAINSDTEKVQEKIEENNNIDMETCTDITQKIIKIHDELNELDEYFEELPNIQSKKDEEICDLLHYIENNELTPRQSSKMIKLLHQKRLERRNIKNDVEMKRVYNTHKNKIITDTQRPFFLGEIYKKSKELNCEYKNRQLSDEEIKGLLK